MKLWWAPLCAVIVFVSACGLSEKQEVMTVEGLGAVEGDYLYTGRGKQVAHSVSKVYYHVFEQGTVSYRFATESVYEGESSSWVIVHGWTASQPVMNSSCTLSMDVVPLTKKEKEFVRMILAAAHSIDVPINFW